MDYVEDSGRYLNVGFSADIGASASNFYLYRPDTQNYVKLNATTTDDTSSLSLKVSYSTSDYSYDFITKDDIGKTIDIYMFAWEWLSDDKHPSTIQRITVTGSNNYTVRLILPNGGIHPGNYNYVIHDSASATSSTYWVPDYCSGAFEKADDTSIQPSSLNIWQTDSEAITVNSSSNLNIAKANSSQLYFKLTNFSSPGEINITI